MARLSFVFSVFLVVSVLSGTTAMAAPPPVEAFGKREAISDVIMSPGGTHFAALQWVKGKEVLAVYNPFAANPADKLKMISLHTTRKVVEKVETIFWLNDETIGLVYEWEGRTYDGPLPLLQTRLVAAKVDLSDTWQIPQQVKNAKYEGQFQHQILDYLDDDPEHILMVLDQEGYGRTLNVYKVGIRKGGVQNVTNGKFQVSNYLADQQGRPRIRWSFNSQKAKIEHKKIGRNSWNVLLEEDRGVPFDFWPEEFQSNPDILLVSKGGATGFEEIHEFNLKTKQMGERVFAHAKSDILSVKTDRYSNAVTGFEYAVDSYRTHYTDPELAGVQKAINQALPRTQNTITSYDRNRNRFIILASGPSDPGTYFLFLKDKGRLMKIGGRNAAKLDPASLGTMKAISYTARDGTKIPGYLTTPATGSAPYPLIVMPHGGPVARDYLGWDYHVQFLASRGYAVLQPNFRGSSGFGFDFQKAGYQQWGLLMQDDVTDGAKAMVEQGIADPERMCIVGLSYGGYAALMGAAVTPDLFQCAVSFAGVTDIAGFIADKARFKFATDNWPHVGTRRDRDNKLRDTSPINNIEAIKIPILLVHGDKDLSVDVKHSKRMASALKRGKKKYKLVILRNGNHYLEIEEHRLRFLRELESFLAENIGR